MGGHQHGPLLTREETEALRGLASEGRELQSNPLDGRAATSVQACINFPSVTPSLAAVGTRAAQTTFSSCHQVIPIPTGQEDVEMGSHGWNQTAVPVPAGSAEGLPSDPGPTVS